MWKVAQELMRHASSRCTLEVYSQARVTAKRDTQRRIAKMVLTADIPAAVAEAVSQWI
jgi:hypothetical protein